MTFLHFLGENQKVKYSKAFGVRRLSVNEYSFLFNQNIRNENQKMYPPGFRKQIIIYIYRFLEKLILRIYLRQT